MLYARNNGGPVVVRTFTLKLFDSSHGETIEGVSAFIGEDVSGCFGIQAGHARMMTVLIVGLARFRIGDGDWRYLALPGAVLYFHDDLLTLSSSHYLIDDDYARISNALLEALLEEREKMKTMKDSLEQMEEEIFRRLWKKNRKKTD